MKQEHFFTLLLFSTNSPKSSSTLDVLQLEMLIVSLHRSSAPMLAVPSIRSLRRCSCSPSECTRAQLLSNSLSLYCSSDSIEYISIGREDRPAPCNHACIIHPSRSAIQIGSTRHCDSDGCIIGFIQEKVALAVECCHPSARSRHRNVFHLTRSDSVPLGKL